MRVMSGFARDMQRHHGIERERPEEFLEQFGVHLADLGALEIDVPGQERAPRDVHRSFGKGFIHRDDRIAKAADPALVGKCPSDRGAEDDADVFGGVVEVDVQVAISSDSQVEQAVTGERRPAVSQKAAPVPSRLMVRLMSVSEVLRSIVAMRAMMTGSLQRVALLVQRNPRHVTLALWSTVTCIRSRGGLLMPPLGELRLQD